MLINASQTEGMVSRSKGYTQHIISKYHGYRNSLLVSGLLLFHLLWQRWNLLLINLILLISWWRNGWIVQFIYSQLNRYWLHYVLRLTVYNPLEINISTCCNSKKFSMCHTPCVCVSYNAQNIVHYPKRNLPIIIYNGQGLCSVWDRNHNVICNLLMDTIPPTVFWHMQPYIGETLNDAVSTRDYTTQKWTVSTCKVCEVICEDAVLARSLDLPAGPEKYH
jgi:hypothetical protein